MKTKHNTRRKWLMPVLFAGIFGLMSNLPSHSSEGVKNPVVPTSLNNAEGGGAFKHNIYLGQGRSEKEDPKPASLELIMHYGG